LYGYGLCDFLPFIIPGRPGLLHQGWVVVVNFPFIITMTVVIMIFRYSLIGAMLIMIDRIFPISATLPMTIMSTGFITVRVTMPTTGFIVSWIFTPYATILTIIVPTGFTMLRRTLPSTSIMAFCLIPVVSRLTLLH
jgi:hypothetical protein